ncbi:AmmeMemoRadiSam system protein A [Sulfurimonas sp. HSL3-7]|uniref:AmmeMemoRadiSam system protein A n=1 Tax=Sulfonitrofixus jiaomeiensis TaxID=3131938 RepID=UPI0031F8B87F
MTLQDILLKLARASIEEQFGKPFPYSKEILLHQFPELAQKGASFVTINIDGDSLRGCIGSLLPRTTLFDDVIHNAKAAAFSDTRFYPLSEGEYPYCSIEISILGLPRELSYSDTEDLRNKIRPGIDGVILQQEKHVATFLPQVWEEFPDFDYFFSQLGVKAGVRTSALDGHPKIYTYEAERFEDTPLEDAYTPLAKEDTPHEEENTTPAGDEGASAAARFSTPQDAEIGFYNALERGDLDAMLAVWADDEAVVCIHPVGERLQGRDAVAQSWREMFAGEPAMQFELEDVHFVKDDQLSIHTLRERIIINGEPAVIAIATNVYQLTDGGWRLLMHHASPDPAAWQ